MRSLSNAPSDAIGRRGKPTGSNRGVLEDAAPASKSELKLSTINRRWLFPLSCMAVIIAGITVGVPHGAGEGLATAGLLFYGVQE